MHWGNKRKILIRLGFRHRPAHGILPTAEVWFLPELFVIIVFVAIRTGCEGLQRQMTQNHKSPGGGGGRGACNEKVDPECRGSTWGNKGGCWQVQKPRPTEDLDEMAEHWISQPTAIRGNVCTVPGTRPTYSNFSTLSQGRSPEHPLKSAITLCAYGS